VPAISEIKTMTKAERLKAECRMAGFGFGFGLGFGSGFGFVSARTMGVSLAVTQCVHCPSQDICRGEGGKKKTAGGGLGN